MQKKWVLASLFTAFSLAAAATLERDIDFLVRFAPPRDLPLPADFVTNNCLLAAAARASAPEAYPDSIYLDYVLPYSVIREERDDWRTSFKERFASVVAGCTNAYDAAVKLDRSIWDMIGVHYDTRRDKARQSPFHSMRIGMASCTGISIILIDACRALGIPARLVGCNWTTIPGNHSWVEVWSGGRWRVLASGEKEREDSIWFLDYAAMADSSRPDKRIYASRWSPSPEGTRFWLTWDHPQSVSDVPADDVTAKYAIKPRFAIVASPETLSRPEWNMAAEMLAEKHRDDANTTIIACSPANAAAALRNLKPRYAAFLMRQDEFGTQTLLDLKTMMRSLDDDQFDDAIWGIITGPDAKTAQRIASSRLPRQIGSMLATTGVDANVVTGEIATISDAFPKGEWWHKDSTGNISRFSVTGETASVFARFWQEIDPECIVTSSHATERNLEMPFSMGNIVAKDEKLFATPEVGDASRAVPIAESQREKVWAAPGNCLIANHIAPDDMLMTALSFGKVNQFTGYFKETWFGFVGWNCWKNFAKSGYSLAISHYAANQWLLKKLSSGEWKNEKEHDGLIYDRDATIFYGDPMQETCVGEEKRRARRHVAEKTPMFDGNNVDRDDCIRSDCHYPRFIIFPDSTRSHEVRNIPDGCRVFNADDFAIIEND